MAAPATPTGLTATVYGSDAIGAAWNSSAGATGYRLYRSLDDVDYTIVMDALEILCYLYNLKGDTTYYFKVSAYNDDGESALSSSVNVTTEGEDSEYMFMPSGIIRLWDLNHVPRKAIALKGYCLYSPGGDIRCSDIKFDGLQLGRIPAIIDDGDSPYQLDDNDTVILVDATNDDVELLLPGDGDDGGDYGRVYFIKRIDSSGNSVDITPDGSDTIDGAASYSLSSQYEYVNLVYALSGGHWFIFGAT